MALATRLRMAGDEQRRASPQTEQSSPDDEGDLDVACPRRRAGTGRRPRGPRGPTSTRCGFAEGVGDLQPGQLDDLLHQPGQPVGLDLHPLGEARHRLGVVVRVEHRLGQQGDAADRGLQLVADVGDEVAPDLLDAGAPRCGPRRAAGRGPRRGARRGPHDEAAVRPRPLRQLQLGLADHAVAAHLPRQLGAARGGRARCPHQSVGDGGRASC